MEKAVVASPELLRHITNVTFTINGFSFPTLINTGQNENTIWVREMIKVGNALQFTMHHVPEQPMILLNPKEFEDDTGPFYEQNMEIILNGEKERHTFEFRRHPDPDYPIELGLSAIRGRAVDTR